MNRVINNPDLVVEDMLRGILAAHPELSAAPANPRVVSHARAREAGWYCRELSGGHYAMFTQPKAMASALNELPP